MIAGERLVRPEARRRLSQPDSCELRAMKDEALLARAGRTQVFAEVEPNQKERIILALRTWRKAPRISCC